LTWKGLRRLSPSGGFGGPAAIIAGVAMSMVAVPPCAVCGLPSARVELVAAGGLPADWGQWSQDRRQAWQARRGPDQWYLLFEGVAAGNGSGDPVSAERAAQIAGAFREPFTWAQVQTARFYDDAGFCGDCDAVYCYRHWRVSVTGYGRCQRGHGKSLDAHWSPE
jgi:hypothetical protein